MSEIIDVIHEFSYNVRADGLANVTNTIVNQNKNLTQQADLLQRLQTRFDATAANEVKKREQLANAIDKVKNKMREQTAAMEKTILTDKALQSAMEREIGIIGTLEAKLRLLENARRRATSEGALNGYTQQINAIQGQIARLNATGGGMLSQVKGGVLQGLGIAGGFGIAGGIAAGVGFIKDFVKDSAQAASNMEQLQVAFTTMLNSRDKANQLLADLQKFAALTPFEFNQLTQLSKQLLAFGFVETEIIPTLDMLGNVAAGVGMDKLPNIVYAMGQIRANGKLMGQDLLQLVNAGFNPLQVMAEKSGKSMGALRKEMEKGEITFDRVIDAFKSATSEGGKFNNLMQNQSRTTAGAVSNLGDAIDQLKTSLGSASGGPIKAFVSGLTSIINAWKEYIELSPADKIREEQYQVNLLAHSIMSVAEGDATRNDLIAQMRQQYPDFLGKLKDEEITNSLIANRLTDINDAYQKRLELIDATNVKEGLLNEKRNNNKAKVEEAIIQGQLSLLGIDKKVGDITADDLRKLTQQQRDNLQRTLYQKGFLNFWFGNAVKFNNSNLDNSYLANAINRAKALADEATENNKKVDAALQSAFKEEQKAIAEADPIKILKDQRKKYVDALEQQKQLVKTKSGDVRKQYEQAIRDNENNIKVIDESIAKLNKKPAVTDAPGDKSKKDPYKLRLEALEDQANIAKDTDTTLKFLKEREANNNAQYLEYLKSDEGLSGSLEARAIREADYSRLQRRINTLQEIRVNQLEQTELTNKIAAALKFGKSGDAANFSTQLSNLESKKAELDIKLAANIEIIPHIEVKNYHGTSEEITEQIVKSFKAGPPIALPLDPPKDIEVWQAHADAIINAYSEVTNAVGNAFNTMYQAQAAALDREIALRERRVEDALKIAERGNVEALRIEEERLRKAQAQREKIARREQLVNAALTISNAIVAVAKAAAEGAGQGGYGAIATVAATIAALAAGYAAISSLSVDTTQEGFAKGGYTGDGGKYEVAGPVHRGEFVTHQDATRKNRKVLEAMNRGLVIDPSIVNGGYVVDPNLATLQGFGSDIGAGGRFKSLEDKVEALTDTMGQIEFYGFRMDASGVAMGTLSAINRAKRGWKA